MEIRKAGFVRYNIGDTQNNEVSPKQLHHEIAALGLPGFTGVSVQKYIDVHIDPLTEAQKSSLDAAISAHEGTQGAAAIAEALTAAKAAKVAVIEQRTQQIIELGFSYAGKVFSLSESAQRKISGFQTAIVSGIAPFPQQWSTLDNLDFVSLADATEATQFFGQALGTVAAIENSGNALKSQASAATTIAELDAVEDNR